MCDHCGCGAPGGGHHHGHGHGHDHQHDHGHEEDRRTIEVHRSLLEKNDRLAERNRGYFAGRGIVAVNLVSSPGSGKTALLERTLAELGRELPCATIVGDLATDNDAVRLRAAGAPSVQVTTGTVCHLDAHMVHHAVEELDLSTVRILFIENVGNLVCPASFDLGEELRVVVISVTEGEDKPLKYPSIFQRADVVLVNKIDLAQAVGFDRAKAMAAIAQAAPGAQVLEVSARAGTGMAAWYDVLRARAAAKRR